ncbi:MAG: M42 family peptidase [Chloroflexi bacterium]|nr:M42 family peptidase [Chloroflexota bacterium]
MNTLLQQLTEAVGVSGDEKEVRLLIRDLIQEHVDSWHVDPMGNLIAHKKGTGASPLKVLVDAHMDEIGLILIEADSYGTFRFEGVGGLDDRVLLGKVVQVGPKKLPGVIGARPVHLLKGGQYTKVVERDSMRIDIGASSKDNALGKAKPGERATFLSTYEEWGDVAVGKAFDDRAGCAILIELLRGERFPFDFYASFTVQEELGLRGAITASAAIQPDVAIALDCTPAYDLPNKNDESPNVRLGAGPALYVMDSGTIQDPRLVRHFLKTAEAHDIPVQIRRPGAGGTNAGSLQRAAGGTAVLSVSVPGRYLHSPHTMINLQDFAHTRQLVDTALRELPTSH